MTMARSVALVIALIVGASSVYAQSCPTACKPESNGKQGPNTSTISIGFASGFSAGDLAVFQDRIAMWNDTFLQTYLFTSLIF